MTQAIRSPNESLEPTKRFERTEVGVALKTSSAPEPCKVFSFGDYCAPVAQAPAKHVAISDLIAAWEAVPSRREALARARSWVADTFHSADGVTVRTLRMSRGFSQQRLAALVGTSQSHIARIEGGADQLNIDTCRRLAHALEVDLNTLDAALLRQQRISEAT